jgi:hypothetical protein
MILLYTILLAVLASAPASQNLYIAQAQTGRADGQDCKNAYSAAWFNTASHWGPEPARIGPGAVVHLCGTISTDLVVRGSGTAGKPITILFEPDAKLSQPVCATCLTIDNREFIVVDGGRNGIVENTGNGTAGSHRSSIGISALSCQNCEVKHLIIRNIYVHAGTAAEIDHTQLRCIVFSGSNISIHDNVMHDAGWCLINWSPPGATNIRIYNNDIYRIDHGIVLGGDGSTTSKGVPVGPVYVYNNHIHDFANWDTANNLYHHDGIHCYSTGEGNLQAGVHWTGMWIYHNLFDGDTGNSLTSMVFLEPGAQRDGSQTPCMDATSEIHIFGNLFLLHRPFDDPNGVVDVGVHSPADSLQNFDFFNNTLLADDTGRDRTTVGLRIENGATSASQNIKNNIFGGGNFLVMITPNSEMDHNGYVNCASYNCFNGNATFSKWKLACKCDSHSVDATSGIGGVDLASGYLQPGSPLIGKGINLEIQTRFWPEEQRLALTIDRYGNPRGNLWDIGALTAQSGAAKSSQ